MKKFKIVLGTLFLLGFGMVMTNSAKAIEVDVGGGLWDYGVRFNAIFQQSQYSDFYHPNLHRSSALQDTTLVRSAGTETIGGFKYTVAYSWSHAKTGYWYPYQWRSYYDYLNHP